MDGRNGTTLRGLIATVAAAGLTACYAPPPLAPPPPQAQQMAADVAYLADPERHGRELGSEGRDEAALHIAEAFRDAGVAPAMPGRCDTGPPAGCPGVYTDSFHVRTPISRGDGVNIVGLVEGSAADRRGQVIVVGAHYDHVGRLRQLSRDPEAGGIRPGGDDNASGTAAMMEVARRVARRAAGRSVLFVAFDAEELGLIGSDALLDDLPVPLDSVVAMLNLDMVGRLRDGRLEVRGVGSAEFWEPLLQRANRDVGLDLELTSGGGRSDHVTFLQQGVPSLHFFTGYHPDYHRRSDTAERVNVAGMLRVVELVERVVRELGDAEEPGGARGPREVGEAEAVGAVGLAPVLLGARPLGAQQGGRSVAAAIAGFERVLARDVVEDSVGSIAAAVVVNGEVVWEAAFGWADREARVLATPGTLYRVGSVSKTITAMVLTRLVERGVVSLDEPVAGHVPELRRLANLSPDHPPITFRHLATHTAGLAREPGTSHAARGAFRGWKRKLVEVIPATEVLDRPGVGYRYSNIGYGILGLALERAAGRPYEVLVQELVFDPLGMSSSFLVVPREARSRLAAGYVNPAADSVDPRVPRAEHRGRGYKVPNGGVYSTVRDLARLVPALSEGGVGERLLPEALRRTLTGGTGYGRGLQVQRVGDRLLVGHSGAVAGYTAYLVLDPVTATGVVLLRNYNRGATNLGAAAVALLLDLTAGAAGGS